ncbi:MAG: hypothetical protein PHD54_02795 [Desulfuromonadaceae bacterium]|nr:hypothetical protein [Desulfuromonadaceae bacterium]
MSYILDALKKVEHQKARKATAGGMTSISGDLFLERASRPSRGGVGKIVAVIVVVALCTFAVTWFMLKVDKKKVGVGARSAVPTAVATPAAPPSPAPPAPLPAPLPPSLPQQQMPLPTAAAATPSAPPALPQPGVAVSSALEPVKGKLAKAPKVAPQRPKTVVQTIQAPADIKVSGIAWQEERASRRVVINGFLLHEGATVLGAKILEIHRDRVRFSSPAGIFDVLMDGAALLPGRAK